MANNTDFLKLIKPEEGDFADINQLNTNFDTIDEFAKDEKRERQQMGVELDEEIDKKVDKVPGKSLSSNDFTDELRSAVTDSKERAGLIDFPFTLKAEALDTKRYSFTKEQVNKNIPNMQFIEKYCKVDRLFRMRGTSNLKQFKNAVIEWTGEIFQVVGNEVVDNLGLTLLRNAQEEDIRTASKIYIPPTNGVALVYCSCRTKTDYTGYKRAYIIITDDDNDKYVHSVDSDFSPGSYIAFSFLARYDKRYKVQISTASIDVVNLRCEELSLIQQI